MSALPVEPVCRPRPPWQHPPATLDVPASINGLASADATAPTDDDEPYTLADFLDHAARVFHGCARAEAWMLRPAVGLDGRRPIDLMKTDSGSRLVRDHLIRVEYCDAF